MFFSVPSPPHLFSIFKLCSLWQKSSYQLSLKTLKEKINFFSQHVYIQTSVKDSDWSTCNSVWLLSQSLWLREWHYKWPDVPPMRPAWSRGVTACQREGQYSYQRNGERNAGKNPPIPHPKKDLHQAVLQLPWKMVLSQQFTNMIIVTLCCTITVYLIMYQYFAK